MGLVASRRPARVQNSDKRSCKEEENSGIASKQYSYGVISCRSQATKWERKQQQRRGIKLIILWYIFIEEAVSVQAAPIAFSKQARIIYRKASIFARWRANGNETGGAETAKLIFSNFVFYKSGPEKCSTACVVCSAVKQNKLIW